MKTAFIHLYNSAISLRLLTICCAFLTNIFINRILGISLKGQYTAIYAYANLGQMVFSFGICYSYVTLKEKMKNDAKTILCTIIWIQLLIGGVITLISILLNKSLFWIILISVVLICDNQFAFLAIIDDILKRNKILVGISFLNIILLGCVFLLSINNLNIILFCLFIKMLVEIVCISIQFDYFIFSIKIINMAIIKIIFKIGIPTAFLAVLISCNYNIDIFLLDIMKCDDIQIGVYGVAYTLSNMLWLLPDAFKELVYHKSANSFSEKYIIGLVIFNVLICIFICVGFALLGKVFLYIIYGKEYVQAFSATIVLFIGVIPMIAFKLIHPIYVNLGKSLMIIKLLVVSIICNIIFSCLLIPRYEAVGAAVASVISYIVCSLLFLYKFMTDYSINRAIIKESLVDIKKMLLVSFIK